MMIKKDKEAVDKEMTQGATAHLVSLPSSPLDTPCPPIVYKIFLLCTSSVVYKISSISTLHQPFTVEPGHIALPAVIV